MDLTYEDLSSYCEKHIEMRNIKKYIKYGNIEGVSFISIDKHDDDVGSFMEIFRFQDEKFQNLLPVQINYSTMLPGAVKAWHLHFKQEDIWYVPPSSTILVGLVDCRSSSPTEDHQMRFVLGGKPQLLVIPRGVAHGCANLTQDVASLIYFVTNKYDPEDPDEKRLDWDFWGKNFWTMTKD